MLLGLLKKIGRRRRDLRIVVPSATLDAERFAAFFETNRSGAAANAHTDGGDGDASNTATIVSVDGRQHAVDILYADEPCRDYVEAAIETALANLTNIGPGNVTVTGNAGNYNVYFIGRLSGQDVPLLTADRTGITITEALKGDGRDGVELLAATNELPLDELIYDLVFHKVRYNGADQYLQPFAIRAPTATTEIDLAHVERLTPQPGITPFR